MGFLESAGTNLELNISEPLVADISCSFGAAFNQSELKGGWVTIGL
ncbi:conserved protein of unknown function [Ectopseudomonas oleovorans]|uniref:Uncharacterized protein n=1 Tax=Ectopseudomonas oleovorans TaxID=301 RepID=A0A653B8S8_ECTOL|nr:conserved protein of unknown function [Pseudomonas oleovorans]